MPAPCKYCIRIPPCSEVWEPDITCVSISAIPELLVERAGTSPSIQFGTAGERCARLDEALTVVRALWRERRASVEGRVYHPDGYGEAAGDPSRGRLGLRPTAWRPIDTHIRARALSAPSS